MGSQHRHPKGFDTVLRLLLNYLLAFYRSLARARFYGFTNLVGLAIGIGGCLVVLLYVDHEYSIDDYHENAERIYRLIGRTSLLPSWTPYVPGNPVPLLREGYDFVDDAARIMPSPAEVIHVDDITATGVESIFAEQNLLKIFSFDFRVGDPKTALVRPATAVLTATLARRLYGEEPGLGKTFTIELAPGKRVLFEVTGIIDDLPFNSHFSFNVLLSWESLHGLPYCIDCGHIMYFLLTEGANPSTVASRVFTEIRNHPGGSSVEEVSLEPLSDIHFSKADGKGDMSYVILLVVVAGIVLLISSVNYASLAIARSAARGHEIGIRKVVGATPGQIGRQFMAETTLLLLAALPVAMAAVWMLLPTFNNLAQTDVRFDLDGSLFIVVGILLILLVTAVLAGGYPSVYLARLEVTKLTTPGNTGGTARNIVSKSLVVLQFAVSIFLLTAAVVVVRQVGFMRDRDPGFDVDRIVIIDIEDLDLAMHPSALKVALQTLAGVEHVSASVGIPGTKDFTSMQHVIDGPSTQGSPLIVVSPAVDPDYLTTLGLELVAGRNIVGSQSVPGLVEAIANETLIDALGWTSPDEKLNEVIDSSFTIVGVVRDFNYESLHSRIGPVMLMQNPLGFAPVVAVQLSSPPTENSIAGLRSVWSTFSSDPFQYRLLSEEVDGLYLREERTSSILKVFAGLAAWLTWIGLVSLVGYETAQRTYEIGIRKILGATTGRIVRMLVFRYVRIAGFGLLLAYPVVYIVTENWLANFTDSVSLALEAPAIIGFVVILVAVLTVAAQARRSAEANPVDSLRQE